MELASDLHTTLFNSKMTIQNTPANVCYVGNLKDLLITSVTEDIKISISKNGIVVIEEVYSPNHESKVILKIRQLIDELLQVEVLLEGQTNFVQDKAVADISINVNNTSTISFIAIKGGVDTINFDYNLYFKSNWLTWQPQTKSVTFHDPEFLSYYALEVTAVRAKAYFADKSTATVNIAVLSAGKLTTIDTNYGRLSSLWENQPLYIDIWTEVGGVRLSYVQRYILSSMVRHSGDTYIFENTLGGVDTIVFTGSTKYSNEIEVSSALFDETQIDYSNIDQFTITKNTGYIPGNNYRQFVLEFMVSPRKIALFDSRLRPITLKDHSLHHNVFELNDFNFSYQFAQANKYKNIYRSPEAPNVLEIVDPNEDVFFYPRV